MSSALTAHLQNGDQAPLPVPHWRVQGWNHALCPVASTFIYSRLCGQGLAGDSKQQLLSRAEGSLVSNNIWSPEIH